MKYKNSFLIICLIICLFSTASACASEVNNGDNETYFLNNVNYYANCSENIISEDLNDLINNDLNIDNGDNGGIYTIDEDDSFDTFEKLDRLIYNSPSRYNLILKKDYKCVDAYSNSIRIDEPITIDGQGHTIDGNHMSGIFYILCNDVTLKNINFVNSKESAITICGERNYIYNCSFINNSADFIGGAIQLKGSIDSYEPYFSGVVIENSTFINNSASYGGAIYGYFSNSHILNCIFKNNVANYGNSIRFDLNCTSLINNSHFTPDNGNFRFYNDSAIIVILPNSSLDIDDVICKVDHKITLVTRVNSNNFPVNSGSVVFFDEFTKIGESIINNGTATLEYTPIAAGKHNITAIYSSDNYFSSNNTASIVVEKVLTTIISFNVQEIYNGGKYVIATLKDMQGNILKGVNVTVLLNGKTYTQTTNNNGQVKISTNGLAPVKTYKATITFKGNSKYDKSTTTAKVTVKKATPKMTAKTKTFKKSVKTKKYSITLKTNQNKVMKNTKLALKVNGKTYTAKTNAKGQSTFKITKLTKKGTFKATITYKGNAYYNKVTKKVNIKCK